MRSQPGSDEIRRGGRGLFSAHVRDTFRRIRPPIRLESQDIPFPGKGPEPFARLRAALRPEFASLKPDFGATAADYARYRAAFPDSFFDRLKLFGIGFPDQVVVDLGTGTGALARGFAARGCRVTGIDPAAPLLDEARELGRHAGVEVDYRVGRAEDTGLPSGSADVVSAGQCWHWFDRKAAAGEAARILRRDGSPGRRGRSGRLVIAHFDWIPVPGNVVQATEALIEAHNPDWNLAGGTGIHPRWLRGLAEASYRDIETFSYDLDVDYSPEAWRGRVRASAGVGATLPAEAVERFDGELASLLRRRFPGDPIPVPHRVFAIVASSHRSR